MAKQNAYFMDLSIGTIVPYIDEEDQLMQNFNGCVLPSSEIFNDSNGTIEKIDSGLVQTDHNYFTVVPNPRHDQHINPSINPISANSMEFDEFEQLSLDVLEVIGQEEIWFEDNLQSEDFWIEQMPDASADDVLIVSAGPTGKTESKPRSAGNIASTNIPNISDSARDGKTIQDKPVTKCGNIKMTTSANEVNKGACDNTKMFVGTTSDTKTKKLCCPFCLTLFSKLARHMEVMHQDEKEVKRFMRLPKGSKERHAIQGNLRKIGTHKFNSDADLNKSELIVCRRPNAGVIRSATDYTVCPYCMGFYSKTNLRHHSSGCNANPEKKSRILKSLAVMMEGRVHIDASTRLIRVMSFMRQDVIVSLIRYDWLLIVYGNKLCCKYTPHYQENMIRARLRLMGRLLHAIKTVDSAVTDFASIYHVERYDSLVSAIKVIGRFDPETNEFGAPAMASCSVTFVKQIGKYLCAEYIRLRDRENKVETEDFLTYMDSDIGISINKLVAETQQTLRRRKQDNIPTMDDVKLLMAHINNHLKTTLDALSKGYSEDEWIRLAELIVAWIIVFNRRRVGEVQNITVEEFLCRQSVEDQQILSSLSVDGQTIAKKFKRMKIRGKLGRAVPVLLKPIVDEAIKLLLSFRQEAGISTARKFLFELPLSCQWSIKCVNACQVLRYLSISCGASNPLSLRGTTLRKHMASTCISLELNDALVAEVANFMGHSEKIHRQCYRKNPLENEIVQMAQVLEAAVGECDLDDDDYDLCDGSAGSCGGCADHSVGSSSNDIPNEQMELGDDDNRSITESRIMNEKADTTNRGPINEQMELDDDEDNYSSADASKSKITKSSAGNSNGGLNSKKKFSKVRWTKEEVAAVKNVFAIHLRNGTFPKEQEIREQQSKNPVLKSRSWKQINAWISNQKIKKKSF